MYQRGTAEEKPSHLLPLLKCQRGGFLQRLIHLLLTVLLVYVPSQTPFLLNAPDSVCFLIMGSASSKAFLDDEYDSVPRAPGAPPAPSRGPSTNVFDIRLYILSEPCQAATGDPVLCENCQGVLNCFSNVTVEGEDRTWKCEFCGCLNKLDIDSGEIPAAEMVTYVIEGAPPAEEESKATDAGDETSVIFAIDTSGSMGVTQVIDAASVNLGRLKLNDGPQKYISRLQCVQLAVESQIAAMAQSNPRRRIGFVQFSNQVNVMGGSGAARNMPSNLFNNFEGCMQYFEGRHDELLNRPVGEISKELADFVYSLKPSGGTSLGPGLLASLSLASEGKSGSKIIVCTDGLANQGLGNVEMTRPVDVQQAEEFYEKVGQLAQQRGVSISVISLVSAECKLNFLASVAELTEGNILKVDPMRLSEDFASILAEKILATDVKATVILHKALKFKNEPTLLNRGSKLVRVIGNASQFSSFTFEYANKTRDELVVEEVDLSTVTQIPFQLVLEYKDLKCVTRVLSVSRNQQEVMQDANVGVLARNLEYQGMNLAQNGQYGELKEMQEQYQAVFAQGGRSESEQLQLHKAAQKMELLKQAVEEQEESDLRAGVPAEGAESKKQKKRAQKDKLSVAIHQLKKAI